MAEHNMHATRIDATKIAALLNLKGVRDGE